MKNNYTISDVLEITFPGTFNREPKLGIVYISDICDNKITKSYMYRFKTIKGNISWDFVYTEDFSTYIEVGYIKVKYLGNFKKNKALRLLYGI